MSPGWQSGRGSLSKDYAILKISHLGDWNFEGPALFSGMEQTGEENNNHTQPLADSPFHQEHELSTRVRSSNNPLRLQTPGKAPWLFWLQKPEGLNKFNDVGLLCRLKLLLFLWSMHSNSFCQYLINTMVTGLLESLNDYPIKVWSAWGVPTCKKENLRQTKCSQIFLHPQKTTYFGQWDNCNSIINKYI